MAGGDDARTDVPAVVDRALQRDVEQVAPVFTMSPRFRTVVNPASSVFSAFRAPRSVRYAGSSCTPCIGSGSPVGCLGSTDEEVELHVHQAGQEGDVAEVEDRAAWLGTSVGSRVIRLPSTTIEAGERTSPATTSGQRAAGGRARSTGSVTGRVRRRSRRWPSRCRAPAVGASTRQEMTPGSSSTRGAASSFPARAWRRGEGVEVGDDVVGAGSDGIVEGVHLGHGAPDRLA